jgi:hypothetical protein
MNITAMGHFTLPSAINAFVVQDENITATCKVLAWRTNGTNLTLGFWVSNLVVDTSFTLNTQPYSSGGEMFSYIIIDV